MKKGVTIIELMIVLIILALISTALFRVFNSAQKTTKEITENHTINDKLDRLVIKITDDLREANYVYSDFPPIYKPNEISNLKTDPNISIKFIKVDYDFTKNPANLPPGKVNFTKNLITYKVEKEDPGDPKSKWLLLRQLEPYDDSQNPITSQKTIRVVMTGLKDCIFYRIKDSSASRLGNLYVKLVLKRDNKKQLASEKYGNEVIIAVKERGVKPENAKL